MGRISVANLAAGEVRQVGPLVWDPPSPAPSDHFCLYVRAQSPQDPIAIAETANVSSNASNSNNIVWRNINVVDLMSSRTVTFLARHVGSKAADLSIELSVPEALLAQGEVYLRLSPGIERNWLQARLRIRGLLPADRRLGSSLQAAVDSSAERPKQPRGLFVGAEPPSLPPHRVTASKVRLTGLPFEPRQAEPLALTFVARERLKGAHDVDVVQRVAGRLVGGIRFVVRSR